MTEAEEQGLRELGNDLAAALQSEWEPRCISRTFRTPAPDALVLTMQGAIDLEDARSPLLQGRLPETVEQLRAAFDAFGRLELDPTALFPDAALHLALLMRDAVVESFAMALPMRELGAASATSDDGFGRWLPLLACLVTQCGLSMEEALALPVGRAFALVAAMRRNDGWEVAGTSYALREVSIGEEASNG